MSSHRASCTCGQLAVSASADPDVVIACNCRACQKIGGSPFATVAYFRTADLTFEGTATSYARGTDAGRTLEMSFCPVCGSTVYWTTGMRPDHTGVTVGTFDTARLTPTRVVWAEEKADWVSFPAHWEVFPKGSDGPRISP